MDNTWQWTLSPPAPKRVFSAESLNFCHVNKIKPLSILLNFSELKKVYFLRGKHNDFMETAAGTLYILPPDDLHYFPACNTHVYLVLLKYQPSQGFFFKTIY